MKKYFCITLIYITCYAGVENEVLLQTARTVGITQFQQCILNQPETDPQRAFCDGLRVAYTYALQALNAPDPLLPTKDISQYAWSPWDVCRYEVTHFVFDKPGLGVIPYCPTIPLL